MSAITLRITRTKPQASPALVAHLAVQRARLVAALVVEANWSRPQAVAFALSRFPA